MPEYHVGTRVEDSRAWGQYGTIIEEPILGRERGKALVMWDNNRENPVKVKKFWLNVVTKEAEENMNRFKIGDHVIVGCNTKGIVVARPGSNLVSVRYTEGIPRPDVVVNVNDVLLDPNHLPTKAVPGSSYTPRPRNPDLYDTPVDLLVSNLQNRVTKLEDKAKPKTNNVELSPVDRAIIHAQADGGVVFPSAGAPSFPKSDSVVRPKHYDLPGGIQVIDVIAGETFERGSILKYIFRAPKKGTELEDLKKAANLLAGEIARVEKREKDKRLALESQVKRTTDFIDMISRVHEEHYR